MKEGKLYINGEWCEGSSKMSSYNPSNNNIIGNFYNATESEVNLAVNSAQTALSNWKNIGVQRRSEYLKKVTDILIQKYGDEGESTYLKKLIQEEVGKRLPEADIEVIESSDMINFFADEGINVLKDEDISLNQELWADKKSFITHEAVGVIGIIKPWNYPLELPLWAIGAALIAGNTIVFKPSEYSSFIGLEIGKIFDEAGIPNGVFNIVTGDGKTGEVIVNHPKVNMISFTGSYNVGKSINIKCAESFKKVNLELSGNDAAIVLDDADLELTTNGIVWGAYCNAGQVCVGAKRILIHKDIAEEFISLVLEKTKKLRLGIDIAPIVNKKQLIIIDEFIEDAKNKGAKILVGGKIKDNYFEPTVLTNINNDMQLMNEELFGPVLPIIIFDNIEEAINITNDSEYGLGASIWTKNLEKAKNISKELLVGMVWFNDINVAFPEAPWSGIKGSGNGVSLSKNGILEYTNVKHINYEFTDEKSRIWWFPY